MAQYAVGEKVRLSSTRGGWEGIIIDTFGGPVGRHYYSVRPSPSSQTDVAFAIVDEVDIDTGGLSIADYAYGDSVNIGLWSAEVSALVRWRYGEPVKIAAFGLQPFGPMISPSSFAGDDFEVTIKDSGGNSRILQDRRHIIPRWRLVLMND